MLALLGAAESRGMRMSDHSDLRDLFFDRLDEQSLRCLADVWARVNPPTAAENDDATR